MHMLIDLGFVKVKHKYVGVCGGVTDGVLYGAQLPSGKSGQPRILVAISRGLYLPVHSNCAGSHLCRGVPVVNSITLQLSFAVGPYKIRSYVEFEASAVILPPCQTIC